MSFSVHHIKGYMILICLITAAVNLGHLVIVVLFNLLASIDT